MAKKQLKEQLSTEIKNEYINANQFSPDDLVNLVDHADYLFKNKYKARKKYKDIHDITTQHKWENVGREFIGYYATFDSFMQDLEKVMIQVQLMLKVCFIYTKRKDQWS